MDVDVPQTSSSSPVGYEQAVLYETDTYDILEEGVVVASNTPPQPAPVPQATYYSPDRYEQLSNSWTRPKLTARKMKSKLFRSPPREQPASFQPVEPAIQDQAFLDETSRAVSSVNQHSVTEDVDEERVTKIKYRPHFPQIECQPSTSLEPQSSQGSRPLNRLTIQIGKKVLRFKVADANPVAPVCQDVAGKFRCASCRMVFRTHDDYQKHNKSLHAFHNAFVCVVCGTGFTNKAALTMHLKIHNGIKSGHECNICHKIFSRSSNLLQHLKMHQTGRHHFCEMCGRCFKELGPMMEHQATCISLKNGEFVQLDKPLRYQCGYCDKLFHHKRDKFIHERIHTGEKPYQCGYCGRGFTQSQALTIHIRNHTGERPFNCSYCPKQFKDSSSLRKHEFRSHLQVDFMDYDESSKIESGVVEEEYDNTIWK